MSQLFALGGHSIGASASASVLLMNTQGLFPLGLTGLISLLSKGLSRVFLKASVFWCSAFFMAQLSHLYVTIGKIIALTPWTFVGKVMPLLFNMLSRFIIAFPPRRKHPSILWLWSLSTVVLEPKKIKSVTHHFFPSICHEVMELDAMILSFFMLSFKPAFSLSFFTLIKTFFNSFSLSAFRMVSSAYLKFLVLQSLWTIPAK